MTTIYIKTILLLLLICSLIIDINCLTKYYIDLPAKFIETLHQQSNTNTELWHPKLTIKRVIEPLSKSITHPLLKENQFSSFLQIQSSTVNPIASSLLNLANNDSSINELKMLCQCRFIKDPPASSFIQTSQEVGKDDSISKDNIHSSSQKPEDKSIKKENLLLEIPQKKVDHNDVQNKTNDEGNLIMHAHVALPDHRSNPVELLQINGNINENTKRSGEDLENDKMQELLDLYQFINFYKTIKQHQLSPLKGILDQVNQRENKQNRLYDSYIADDINPNHHYAYNYNDVYYQPNNFNGKHYGKREDSEDGDRDMYKDLIIAKRLLDQKYTRPRKVYVYDEEKNNGLRYY